MDAAMEQQTPKRRRLVLGDDGDEALVYRFKVLLPNGTSISFKLQDPRTNMPLRDFVAKLEDVYTRTSTQSSSRKSKRNIKWSASDLFLEDANDSKIRGVVDFKKFKPDELHILRLHDGLLETADTFENMWDLTPVTQILTELPAEYTFETALADLIDNSLQAVWANKTGDVKLISVDVADDVISIFDTGPGMDGSDANCLVNWGKMGSSLHRSVKDQAIGGKPPYLKPYFGMFGFGGPLACMHLGRHALVSSMTKTSRKVYTLHLSREALLGGSKSGSNWKTDGGMRDPLKDELSKTPHESFTKVEIFKPRVKLDINQLKCKLKDIYFPYIQCDEETKSGKTVTPVNFEVNGDNLAGIEGGEIAITNFHSSNGPDFVLLLHFSSKKDSMTSSSNSKVHIEANARLKCVYFPMIEGKENMERICESLESDGYKTSESFETCSRVSVRRLGRLLPDARWAWLPFMEFKLKKGDKADLLKRCALRVKCFIDTDAGFNPTPSKTDLARHNTLNDALRDFGKETVHNGKDIKTQIYKDGKQLTPSQLKKEYEDWILKMHEQHDNEADCGEDQPIVVVSPANKKELRISSEVARVHKSLKRKGRTWTCGQKIKLFKGACSGIHKNNVYATIEYFLLEGLEGDSGGGARILCRPLSLSDDKGCILSINDGDTTLDIRNSLSVPVSVIDSGKCVVVESADWESQLEKQRQKSPSTIDLLDATQCQELGVDGTLPLEVSAGEIPPEVIVAVVRPASYASSSSSKTLDQNCIARTNLEMSMEVHFRRNADDLQNVHHILVNTVPKSLHGIQGLYMFPLRSKYPDLFKSAGVTTFSFRLDGSNCKDVEKIVRIKQAPQLEYEENQSHSPIRKVLFLKDSSHLPQVKELKVKDSPQLLQAKELKVKDLSQLQPEENLKVPVVKSPKLEYEIQVPCSHGLVSPLQDFSSFQQAEKVMVPVIQAPNLEHDENQSPCTNGLVLHPQHSSSLPHPKDWEKLEKNVYQFGLLIKDREDKLCELIAARAEMKQEIDDLEAALERYQLSNSNYCSMKEDLINCIKSMNHTAASTLCTVSRGPFQESNNHFIGDVIGLVALLGRVRTTKLSRVLSEYLGEDQMLALVCKSFEAAVALEKYGQNGEVDCRHALHAEAALLGKSINGRFLVICLEDIRPYTGEVDSSDSQRKLALPDPILPRGDAPDGFLGYAVNMVDLDDHQLHIMTAAGHGLRQTLLYFLFGKLQVYETRQDMLAARACINQGAVSLDGGILKPNGAISLGCGNPEICFPVLTSLINVAEVVKEIEKEKTSLDTIDRAIEDLKKSHEIALTKFRNKEEKCYEMIRKMDEVMSKAKTHAA